MKRNVLLIVVDTARAKSFSSLGNKVLTTPGLDELGREGMYYTRCISASPWTTPSHASLFTGELPSEHGTYGKNFHFNSEKSLALKFKKAGYRTFGISANKLASSLNGFHKGFDVFLDPWTPFKEKPFEKERDISKVTVNRSYLDKILYLFTKRGINVHFKKRFGVNENAKYSTDRAMKTIKNIFRSEKEPKFIFANIMQPHEKYNPPPRSVRELGYTYKKIKWPSALEYYAGTTEINEEMWKTLRSLYEGEIRYADEKISELLEWMKKKRHLENTIVIVTSDHGEHIGEHNHFTHFFSLFNELLHVPLIIYHPDHRGIGSRNGLVQLHDMYRTLLESELGKTEDFHDVSSEYGPINIFTDKRKQAIAQLIYPLWIKGVTRLNPAINEETSDLASKQLALFQDDEKGLKKICWDSRKGIAVYDLEKDWEELNPLHFDSVQYEKMETAINNAAEGTNFALTEEGKSEVSEDIKRQLADLGYM